MKIQLTKPERMFLQTAVAAVGDTLVQYKAIEQTDWPKMEALKRLYNQLSPESVTTTLGGDDCVVLKAIITTAQEHLKVAERRTLTEEQQVRLLALTEVYESVRIKLNQGNAQKETTDNGSTTTVS